MRSVRALLLLHTIYGLAFSQHYVSLLDHCGKNIEVHEKAPDGFIYIDGKANITEITSCSVNLTRNSEELDVYIRFVGIDFSKCGAAKLSVTESADDELNKYTVFSSEPFFCGSKIWMDEPEKTVMFSKQSPYLFELKDVAMLGPSDSFLFEYTSAYVDKGDDEEVVWPQRTTTTMMPTTTATKPTTITTKPTTTAAPTTTTKMPTKTAAPTTTPMMPTTTAVPTTTAAVPTTTTTMPITTTTEPTTTAAPTTTTKMPTTTTIKPTITTTKPTTTAAPTTTTKMPTKTAASTTTPMMPTTTAVPTTTAAVPTTFTTMPSTTTTEPTTTAAPTTTITAPTTTTAAPTTTTKAPTATTKIPKTTIKAPMATATKSAKPTTHTVTSSDTITAQQIHITTTKESSGKATPTTTSTTPVSTSTVSIGTSPLPTIHASEPTTVTAFPTTTVASVITMNTTTTTSTDVRSSTTGIVETTTAAMNATTSTLTPLSTSTPVTLPKQTNVSVTTTAKPTTTQYTTTATPKKIEASCLCEFGSYQSIRGYNLGLHKLSVPTLIPQTKISADTCNEADQLCRLHCTSRVRALQLDINGAATDIGTSTTLGDKMCQSIASGYSIGPDLGVYYSLSSQCRSSLASRTTYSASLIVNIDNNMCCRAAAYPFFYQPTYRPCSSNNVKTAPTSPPTTTLPPLQSRDCNCRVSLRRKINSFFTDFARTHVDAEFIPVKVVSGRSCDEIETECHDYCRDYVQDKNMTSKTLVTSARGFKYSLGDYMCQSHYEELKSNHIAQLDVFYEAGSCSTRSSSLYDNRVAAVIDPDFCCARSLPGHYKHVDCQHFDTTVRPTTTLPPTTTTLPVKSVVTVPCQCEIGLSYNLFSGITHTSHLSANSLIPPTSVAAENCQLANSQCEAYCRTEATKKRLTKDSRLPSGQILGNYVCEQHLHSLSADDDASLDVFYDTRSCNSHWTANRKAATLSDDFCCSSSFLSSYHYTCASPKSTEKPLITSTETGGVTSSPYQQTDRCQCNLTISSTSPSYKQSWPLFKVFREDKTASQDYYIKYNSASQSCGLAMQECHKICEDLGNRYFKQGLSTQLSWYGSQSHISSNVPPYTNSLDNFVCDQIRATVSDAIDVSITRSTKACPDVKKAGVVVGSSSLCCRLNLLSSSWLSTTSSSYIPTTCSLLPTDTTGGSLWGSILG